MFELEVTSLERPLSLDRTVEFWLIVLFFSNDHQVGSQSGTYFFGKMDAVPADLQPPQLIYIMLMCLRALAVQAGVFVSPADMSWEQANPNGANGPVGCTIGDGSNLGSALGCTVVSDSDSEPKEPKPETVSGKAQGPEKNDGPREPPFPPPRRRRKCSSSSDDDHPWKKKGKK